MQKDEVFSYIVTDVSGRILTTGEVRSVETKINLRGLNSGSYLIQFSSQYRTVTKKIQVN